MATLPPLKQSVAYWTCDGTDCHFTSFAGECPTHGRAHLRHDDDMLAFIEKTARRPILLTPEEVLGYWAKRLDLRATRFVYFIGEEGSAAIKIGSTDYVRERLTALQVGNPRRLRLDAVVLAGPSTERELHRGCAHHRLLGEWFLDSFGSITAWAHRAARAQIEAYERQVAFAWPPLGLSGRPESS